jgi:hypothetical protein
MAITRPKPNTTPAPNQAPAVAPITRTSAASTPGSGAVKFVRASASTNRRMIISVCGEEKAGKNYFSFTFPGPIYVHSFDIGLEGTIDQFVAKKEIYVAEYELEVQPGMATPAEVAESASKLWDNFTSNYKDSLSSAKQGTVVIDTDTEVYELLRLARFGKLTQVMPHHYGPVNAEFRDIVRSAYDHQSNLFMIGRLGDEWLNDASGKGNKTGQRIRKGFGDLPYLTQINALCQRVDLGGGGSTFEAVIESCRFNPECNGATVGNEYEALRLAVFGE